MSLVKSDLEQWWYCVPKWSLGEAAGQQQPWPWSRGSSGSWLQSPLQTLPGCTLPQGSSPYLSLILLKGVSLKPSDSSLGQYRKFVTQIYVILSDEDSNTSSIKRFPNTTWMLSIVLGIFETFNLWTFNEIWSTLVKNNFLKGDKRPVNRKEKGMTEK